MTEAYSGTGRPTDPLDTDPLDSPPVHDGSSTTGATYAQPDTTYTEAGSGGAGGSGGDGSTDTKQAVKDEATEVASTLRGGATRVAGAEKDMVKDTASEALGQAKETAAQARSQAKDLFAQGRSEVTQGANDQLRRLSGGASALSGELSSMADGSSEQGLAAELARQASSYLQTASSWLEEREVGDVMQDVTAYARRRPGTFLAIAAGLGLVAGRVARSLKDESSQPTPPSGSEEGEGTSTSALSGYQAADPSPDGTAPTTAGYPVVSEAIPLTAASTPAGTAAGTPSGGYGVPGGEVR